MRLVSDRQAAWRAELAENSSRQAWVWQTFTTTGWGEFTFPDEVVFGLMFAELPMVAYSFALDPASPSLVDTRYPRASGGVCAWNQDPSGLYYLGATCFVTVDTQSPGIVPSVPDPGYQLVHHFGFSGVGVKIADWMLGTD